MNIFGTSTTAADVIGSVATSTTNNFAELAPIFVFAIGLVVAMGIIAFLIAAIRGGRHTMDFDDNMEV